MNLRERVQEIWDEIPELHCKGLCHHQCTLVEMSEAEKQVIHGHGGLMPRCLSELNDEEYDRILLSRGTKVPSCPALTTDKRCSIYEVRPSICRLYGHAKRLACPHGCKPDVWIPETRVTSIIERLKAVEVS